MGNVTRFLWDSYTRPFVGIKDWLVGFRPRPWSREDLYFTLGVVALVAFVMTSVIMFAYQWWWLILVVMPLGRMAWVCSDRSVDLAVYGSESKYYRRSNGS